MTERDEIKAACIDAGNQLSKARLTFKNFVFSFQFTSSRHRRYTITINFEDKYERVDCSFCRQGDEYGNISFIDLTKNQVAKPG